MYLLLYVVLVLNDTKCTKTQEGGKRHEETLGSFVNCFTLWSSINLIHVQRKKGTRVK